MQLLELPADILSIVCDELPLASLLVFRLQVCRALRYHPQLGRLRFGILSSTLSFAEWQQAAQELRTLGLARPDDVDEDGASLSDSSLAVKMPALPSAETSDREVVGWHGAKSLMPKAQRLDVAFHAMLNHGPARDARLFRRVLAFLGLIDPNKAIPRARPSRGNAVRAFGRPPRQFKLPTPLESELQPSWASTRGLRCITAACWHGISGETLAYLLRTEPALTRVRLVVKSERFDDDAWKTDFSHPSRPQQSMRETEFISEDDYSGGPASTASSSRDGEICPYVETQVIARLGSEAPAGIKVKGHGLFAGYSAYCYSAASPQAEVGDHGSRKRDFHVVFLGRFDLAEALETEKGFIYSALRCDACQNTLKI